MFITSNYILVATEKYWPEFSEGEWKDVAIFSDKAKMILLDHMKKRGAMEWELNTVIEQYEAQERELNAIINK